MVVKKLAFAILAAAFLTAPVLAQTTPAPAPTAPSAEPATAPTPAKTAMKKKMKHPAKKPIKHVKPKAPAESEPPASDQD